MRLTVQKQAGNWAGLGWVGSMHGIRRCMVFVDFALGRKRKCTNGPSNKGEEWIVVYERSSSRRERLTCMRALSVCVRRMRHVVRDAQEGQDAED